MSVSGRLASALGRRDEQPNIALAGELAETGDKASIAELADLLATGTKPLRHDAIKTLYELGERQPRLIAPHAGAFLALLADRDNRMIWGALSALNALTPVAPDMLMANLGVILDAADKSSVIASDKIMAMLTALNANSAFSPIVWPVIADRLQHAPVNQFPMYAEFAAQTVAAQNRPELIGIIGARKSGIAQRAKKARLDKLLRKIERAREA